MKPIFINSFMEGKYGILKPEKETPSAMSGARVWQGGMTEVLKKEI